MLLSSRHWRLARTCVKVTRGVAAAGVARRSMSGGGVQRAVLDTQQGDSLVVECNVSPVTIDVTSAWQEHCDVSFSKTMHMSLKESVESDKRTFTLSLNAAEDNSATRDASEAVPALRITAPELFNIAIRASDANITFRNKIMGDVAVACTSGSVILDQLRGEYINLHCDNANLEVKKKLEGNVSVSCKKFTAQMIHGDSVDISAHDDVRIKALYSVNSSISSSSGSVQIGLAHGHTAVSSALSCSLSGIDGSFVVNNTDGGATLQINKMYPGSESMAISRNGSITTLVDPDVITRLSCSTKEEDCITIESDGFDSTKSSSTTSEGVFSGQSSALKRPTSSSSKFKRKSGKINVESAALLSLRNTTKADVALHGDTTTQLSLPFLSLAARLGIVVESVSWIGRIMKNIKCTENCMGAMLGQGIPPRVSEISSG